MRLGKEQAAGYVEDTGADENTVFTENTVLPNNTGLSKDTGADALPAEELATARPDGPPPTPSADPPLNVA